MRKIFKLCLAAFLTIGVIFGSAVAANADTGTVTVTNPVYTKTSSSAVSTGASSAYVSTSSKVQGEWIAYYGYHPYHPTVHYIRAGTWYMNSFRNRYGHIQYFKDRCGYGSPYTRPLTSGTYRNYCVFYYDSHYRVWRKPDCGNFVKFYGTFPTLAYTSVALYRSFSYITWTVRVRLYEAGTVTATATCSTPYSSASATATASASAYVYVSIYVSAKYSTSAMASGTYKVSSSSWSSLAATVSAKAQYSIKASATATCTYTPQPAPTPAPTVVSLEQPNDVYPNEARTICATVNVANPDSGTVTFSAQYGTISNGSFSVGSGTSSSLCANYTGPGEVPASGTDTVTVFVSDSTTGQHDQKSVTFNVLTPPPPPA